MGDEPSQPRRRKDVALLALGLTLVVVGVAAKAWTAGAEGSMIAVMALWYVAFLVIATAIVTAIDRRRAREVPDARDASAEATPTPQDHR